MITLAVTAVGGGVGQSVFRALNYRQIEVRVVGFDISPMSAGLYWVDAAYLIPPAKFEKEYLESLLAICAHEAVDVLIPGSDPELEPLALHKDLFSDQGCTVIVASPEVVQLCRDKRMMYEFCRERGLPFIKTYLLSEARSQIDQLTFPAIAKPRGGSASVGVRILFDPDDLMRIPPDADLIVQPYLPPYHSDAPQLLDRSKMGRLDQSNETSIQFYVGGSGEILGSYASVNCLKDGVPIEVMPDPCSPALPEAAEVAKALAVEGLRGPINIQGRLSPDGYRFFEINPRYTGITGVRAAMGYREVEAGIYDFFAKQEEEARHCLSFQPGWVAVRYVEDAIVAKERVECFSQEEPLSKNRQVNMPTRVLVTGASGYIGANVVASLLNLPEIQEVRAGVRSDAAAIHLRDLLGDSPKLNPVIGKLPLSPWSLEGIEAVIHLASVRPPESPLRDNEEIFKINGEGTRPLLEVMRDSGIARLIFLSSQSVYGARPEIPWSEMLAPRPDTAYGFSKWVGEQLCINSGLATVVLRASRIYGLGYYMRWEELLHKFAVLAARGKPLPIYGGGQTRMDILHLRDLCDAIIKACLYLSQNLQPIIFNVASGQCVSVMRLASLCQSAAVEVGLPEPPIEHRNSDKTEMRSSGLDIQRARTFLGWLPTISLEQGIRELINAAKALNTIQYPMPIFRKKN